nr:hypothetical protein [Nocardioides convexus]
MSLMTENPTQSEPDEQPAATGAKVEVRRNVALSAGVGGFAALMTAAFAARAFTGGTVLDWLTFGILAVVTVAHLASLADGRAPLLVADEHGVRLRQGATWRGIAWDDIDCLEHLPRRGVLHDGHLLVDGYDDQRTRRTAHPGHPPGRRLGALAQRRARRPRRRPCRRGGGRAGSRRRARDPHRRPQPQRPLHRRRARGRARHPSRHRGPRRRRPDRADGRGRGRGAGRHRGHRRDRARRRRALRGRRRQRGHRGDRRGRRAGRARGGAAGPRPRHGAVGPCRDARHRAGPGHRAGRAAGPGRGLGHRRPGRPRRPSGRRPGDRPGDPGRARPAAAEHRPGLRAHPDPSARDRGDRGRRLQPVRRRLLRSRPPAHHRAGAGCRRRTPRRLVRRALRPRAGGPAPGLPVRAWRPAPGARSAAPAAGATGR